jgi:hypothetical protein
MEHQEAIRVGVQECLAERGWLALVRRDGEVVEVLQVGLQTCGMVAAAADLDGRYDLAEVLSH